MNSSIALAVGQVSQTLEVLTCRVALCTFLHGCWMIEQYTSTLRFVEAPPHLLTAVARLGSKLQPALEQSGESLWVSHMCELRVSLTFSERISLGLQSKALVEATCTEHGSMKKHIHAQGDAHVKSKKFSMLQHLAHTVM